MPFIPVPDVAEVHVRGTLNGKNVENLFYAQKDEGWNESDLILLASEVSDVWIELALDGLSPQWVGREVYARDMSTEIAAQATNTDLLGVLGTAAVNTFENHTTLAIARRSGLTGRSARGRIFWMGVGAGMLATANTVSSVYRDIFIATCEGIDTAMEGILAVPVIVSKYTAGAPRLSGVYFPIAEWTVIDDVIDTRRKRIPKS